MAAYTNQIRRFFREDDFEVPLSLRPSGASLPAVPLAKTLQVLHTQIQALILDTTMREREESCRKAAARLTQAGWPGDVDATTVGMLLRTQGFNARRSMANRNRVSERLGALAAWKWVDLLEALRKPRTRASNAEVIDCGLATISVLVFESMESLSGELGAMADKARNAAATERKQRISIAAHDGKRRLHERHRKKYVDFAMALREAKPNRSDAVRATLRRFDPMTNAFVPKPRTLHAWLKAEGWTRDSRSED